MEVRKETRVAGETGALRSSTEGKGRYDCVLLGYPHMILRLARLLEQGIASGYPAGNWKKGTNLRRWLEGSFRHLCQYAEGKVDEDHLIAAIWGLMSLGETQYLVDIGARPAELNDLPDHVKAAHEGAAEAETQARGYVCTSITQGDEGSEIIPNETDQPQRHLTATEAMKLLPARIPDRIIHLGPQLGDRRINPATGKEEVYLQAGEDIIARVVEDVPTYYVCGPMRGYPFLNFPAFDGARDLGLSLGFKIISPADIDRENGIDPIEDPNSPQRAFDKNPEGFVREIVIRDLATILNLNPKNGSGLALLPEWENSTGANAEIAVAHWLGLSFVDATTYEPINDPLEV